jgi:hypothetical protein
VNCIRNRQDKVQKPRERIRFYCRHFECGARRHWRPASGSPLGAVVAKSRDASSCCWHYLNSTYPDILRVFKSGISDKTVPGAVWDVIGKAAAATPSNLSGDPPEKHSHNRPTVNIYPIITLASHSAAYRLISDKIANTWERDYWGTRLLGRADYLGQKNSSSTPAC